MTVFFTLLTAASGTMFFQGVGKWSIDPISVKESFIVGSEHGILAALYKSNGSVFWRKDFESAITSAFSIEDKVLVASTEGGRVLGLDVKSGSILWEKTGNEAAQCKGCQTISIGNQAVDPISGKNLPDTACVSIVPSCNQSIAQSLQQDPETLTVTGPGWIREEVLSCLFNVVISKDVVIGQGCGWLVGVENMEISWRRNIAEITGGVSDTSAHDPCAFPSLSIQSSNVLFRVSPHSSVVIDPKTGRSGQVTAVFYPVLKCSLSSSGVAVVGSSSIGAKYSLAFPESSIASVSYASPAQTQVPVSVDPEGGLSWKFILENAAIIVTSAESLNVRLIDTITGRILWSSKIPSAQGPVHSVLVDNWAVVHYRSHQGWEVLVAEFYRNKQDPGVWAILTGGKENPEISSRPQVVTRQFRFAPGPVRVISATSSKHGVAPRAVLFGLTNGEVLAMNKEGILSAKREPLALGTSPAEGSLPPLTPEIPYHPLWAVTGVERLGKISAIASEGSFLESTAKVVVTGLDFYVTKVHVPSLFDALGDAFDYGLLVSSLAVVAALIMFSSWLAAAREKARKWK